MVKINKTYLALIGSGIIAALCYDFQIGWLIWLIFIPFLWIIETVRALAASGFKLVPDIIAGGGAGGAEGSLVNVLLANLITGKGVQLPPATVSKTVAEAPVAPAEDEKPLS